MNAGVSLCQRTSASLTMAEWVVGGPFSNIRASSIPNFISRIFLSINVGSWLYSNKMKTAGKLLFFGQIDNNLKQLHSWTSFFFYFIHLFIRMVVVRTSAQASPLSSAVTNTDRIKIIKICSGMNCVVRSFVIQLPLKLFIFSIYKTNLYFLHTNMF